MDKQRETNETYNRYAKRYAKRYQNIELAEQLDYFAAQLPLHATVLDIGCGPGRDMGYLRQRGLRVVGMDTSFGMLLEAQKQDESCLTLGDMLALPFKSRSLDGAWLAASFHHLPRACGLAALESIQRVVKPNGVVYISVKRGEGEGWQAVEEGNRFYTFYQPDELKGLLEQAGFQIANEWQETDEQGRQWLDIVARNT